MSRRNGRRTKRIKNLIVIMSLTAIIFSVSTYAWFIGMRTVNVSSFDVEIASTDSLLLSLDGKTWDTTVTISGDTYNDTDVVYEGNTNWWAGRGLLPMSSVGEMDATASRMKIFEKASLTTTPGGYRLMASRVDNYSAGKLEQDGYVAFDLFIKNFSGTQYIPTLEPLDEEAIYLTTDSVVTVADVLSGGVADTGIENSVRVAFAQIGRVAGTTTNQSTITGITCATAGSVTGICRNAQIWEPNDTDHELNAISWYSHSCLKRTGVDVTSEDSYGVDPLVPCETLEDGQTYQTYAVASPIGSADNVDVYDGADYNGYAGSGAKLHAYDFFTDTDKLLAGTARPTFMTLAPNSITKVRIYVYIEGQDIDNYDFASIGRKISVAFGFTKERFTEADIEYNGPNLDPAKDTTDPEITLVGDALVLHTLGEAYVDQGATALDDIEGDLTSRIVVTNTVNVNQAGDYTVTYNVKDWNNNPAIPVVRTVRVQ
jgi:hypothetical protein